MMSLPNVIVTSHQAFLTHEALANIATTTFKNLDDYFAGAPLEQINLMKEYPCPISQQ